ncbi:hypothetical protein HN592_02165 [Candidatus Woesearchaeota archaeon]|jgi:hypothetical protein|nr:hypothetical protein [Candidatus Woesearchaeota archaeon]MBT4368017.1 hypothetical protein [Candidatus Woesearchaeota archaeon]MBT4712505.1 hypothetical protein [Candidatus Woesearchaeota archaeon]MBT6639418.1 hypothetical protein [Candidatus Woesearchaeota archaeon]MBT7133590.1 hypothetical protein [Candidatus Woesearchaeota archaeon]
MIIIIGSVIVLFILFVWALKKWGMNAIYGILPANILIEVIMFYSKTDSFSTGYIRGAFLILFLFIYLRKFEFEPVSNAIAIFLGYTFLLTFFSSNMSGSFIYFSKVFINFMMFPVGFFVVKQFSDLKKLNWALIASLLIIIAQFIFAQVTFGGQSNPYVATGIRLGGTNIQITYLAALGIALFPLLFKFISRKKDKILLSTLLFSALALIFLIFRRISILVAVFAIIFHVFSSSKQPKKFRYLALFFIVLIPIVLISSAWFSDTINDRLFSRGLQEEGRYWETGIVLKELFSSPKQFLVGKELFNSAEYFIARYGLYRQLHMDFNIILHGSGIIGLVLFLNVFLKIIFYIKKSPSQIKRLPDFIFFRKYIILLLISFALFTISGSLNSISYGTFMFFYLGAFCKLIRIVAKSNLKTTSF